MTTRLARHQALNFRRGRVSLWIYWFGAILALAQGSRAAENPIHFDGAIIPSPPRQGSAWEAPPTKLPRFFLTATADLFNAGIADPRGCEYRAVEIGDDATVATHGFVFQDPDHPDRRFVVGWDALIYPALQVGDLVDLDGDIGKLAESIRADRVALSARLAQGGPAMSPFQVEWADRLPPILRPLATVKDSSALKVCLLLRIGRTDLAERLYAAGTTRTPADPPSSLTNPGISLASLASEWSARAYSRAAQALIRSDDVVALEAARRLAGLVDRLGQLKFPRTDPNQRGLGSSPHFPSLPLYRSLLVDLERRAAEPPRATLPGPEAPVGERVAASIRDLDQISSLRQIKFNLRSRNILLRQALIAARDAAVEPLLAAFESDDRLTRYFADDDPFETYRPSGLVPVHTVARSLLIDIFQTRMIPGATESIVDGDAAARRSQAAAMRVFWAKNRSLSELDRLYRTLDDPQASTAEWIDAAEKLTRRDQRDPSSPMKGEPLRSRTNPSVTELLARRIEAIDPAASRLLPDTNTPFKIPPETANKLASLLVTWDQSGAMPVLRSRIERTRCVVLGLRAESKKLAGLENDIVAFSLIRHLAGDPTALEDYAAWVVTTTPNGYSRSDNNNFAPLWRFSDHPAIERASLTLFDNPRSPWIPLYRPDGVSPVLLNNLFSGPMLGIAPFRRLVRAGLDDQTVVGSVTTDAAGEIEIKIGKDFRFRIARQITVPARRSTITSQAIRVADLHLWKLGPIDGLPAAELWWPLAERDRLIAVASATLDHYGQQFRERLDPSVRVKKSVYYTFVPSSPSFDRLDHPATSAEVETGRAIFHLIGEDVRVWSLPSFPAHARWTTRPVPTDDFANPQRGVKMSAQSVQTRLDQLSEAWVWQAEEVRVDGHWQRFFGLVDQDQFVRVPAEEVELLQPAGENWQTFANDFDANLTVGTPQAATAHGGRIDQIGVPVPVEVQIRNHRGITVDAPTEWFRSEERFSMARGVSIHLFYREQPFYLMDRNKPDEREIPPRPVVWHEAGTIPLESAATASLGRFDLRSLFAIDQVGWYRVELVQDGWITKTGGTGTLSRIFEIPPSIDPPLKP